MATCNSTSNAKPDFRAIEDALNTMAADLAGCSEILNAKDVSNAVGLVANILDRINNAMQEIANSLPDSEDKTTEANSTTMDTSKREILLDSENDVARAQIVFHEIIEVAEDTYVLPEVDDMRDKLLVIVGMGHYGKNLTGNALSRLSGEEVSHG